jgi:hypothetical protein
MLSRVDWCIATDVSKALPSFRNVGNYEIEVEGVHSVVCMMNKINMVFITVKNNFVLYSK